MRYFLLLLLTALAAATRAQAPLRAESGDVFVDNRGVLRWQNTRHEVALFGVNYTAPFAYAYRAIERLRTVTHEQAIDQDVYHLSRLGVDAFRVHVWDVEITDTLGNLQANDHLRLLDYLLSKLKARGIKIILTPIAYWGNGYPEPRNTGPGFSGIYDKGQAYTNPRAIRAQENYLGQFLNHRNPYTGLLNRQDPDIIAFEVCNEPHYRLPLAPVRDFANRMVAAMRATGYQKPIFYNIAESPAVKDAILDANVQGVTFQWYPEGLVAGHELKGNLLPYVDQYPLPYKGDARFERRAKMVYEFESADVLQPIMYPFMARSFREAGMQWATMFAYDPLALAHANTEYQTHYLNLAYTPAKALSLLVASRVFHAVRRGQSFGRYPADTVFGAAHVSYRQQLSEWNAPDEFYYTANTSSVPVRPAALQRVAGVGSSALVQYGGNGAYFLDKVAPGIWRLELMPNATQVRDPFETASPSKTVVQIDWQMQPMTVVLPDLGTDFQVMGLSKNNMLSFPFWSQNKPLLLRPGAYLLSSRTEAGTRYTAQSMLGNLRLGEFAALPTTLPQLQVRHQPVAQATAGQPLRVAATITGAGLTDSVFLVARHYYGPTRTVPAQRIGPNTVAATVPAALTYPGLLHYWLVVKPGASGIQEDFAHNAQFRGELSIPDQSITFPGGQPGPPRNWDFYDAAHWEVPLVAGTAPLPLFQADADRGHVEAQGIGYGTAWVDYPTTAAGQVALRLVVAAPRPGQPAPAAPATGPVACLRAYTGLKTAGRATDLGNFKELIIKGQTSQPGATRLRVVLVTKDAAAYAATVMLPATTGEVRVPLSALQPAPLLLSPRPYPGFLPLTFSPAARLPFRLADVEVLQVVLDAPPAPLAEQLRVDVESIALQ